MEKFLAIVAGTILDIILSALFALPVMWLWDWICPSIFGLPQITWAKAWGLLIMIRFISGSKVEIKAW